MSDPVTNAEVEDVLSSIRRLVSDERPGSARTAAAHRERLVLTQALRVRDGDADEETEALDTFVLRDAISPSELSTGSASTEAPQDAVADVEQQNLDSADTALDGNADKAIVAEEDASEASAVTTLSAKIAALEKAIGNISGQWEPDTPGADDYSGTEAPAMVWQDDVDLDATGKPVGGAVVPAAKPADPTPEAEATSLVETLPDDLSDGAIEELLDEDALRALVADIVRSELQGELGARITRNVRKLVRREIHRALAAKELE